MNQVHVLGIRHHGPGSARSVAEALEQLQPDLVVIEGPPELDALLPLVADPDLVPPVAGLVYAVDRPRRAAFYPLATFSPEWVALRWAAAHHVECRHADLPATHFLADTRGHEDPDADPEEGATEQRAGRVVERIDAISLLARTAGYDDPERWWEDAVEHRRGGVGDVLARFATLREAMAEVRAAGAGPVDDPDNQRREAAMRRVLRLALKEGRQRIAVVCGAFHAPVLHPDTFPSVAHDTAMLKGLPRIKVAATWAPWTSSRLSLASGYGAGVSAPGWYQHLFTTWAGSEDAEVTAQVVVPGWLTRVARELRAEGLDAPPASVVEAVRLADALAAVRGRPSVGLAELDDAGLAVLCGGSQLPLDLVHRRLVIGQELGRVPEATPLVPLAGDLTRQQRALKLKVSAVPVELDLDLRRDTPRARSVLLHRLLLLGVPWGEEVDSGRTTGTFKESWVLQWQPELAVALVEAGLYGTTVLDATQARVAETARGAPDLDTLGRLVEQCLTADLPDAVSRTLRLLADRTARQHDTVALLRTVEPLARTRRYGDVRGADTDQVADVLDTLVVRAAVGLRAACASLDDEAATAMRAAVDAAHRGIALVETAALTGPWRTALRGVAADESIHGLVAGRAVRLLLDAGELDPEEVARRLSRRLSVGSVPASAAAWLDGFLEGDALLLVHDEVLLGLVDEWVVRIDESTFDDLLPLLRRTFSRFAPAERRQVGGRLRRRGTAEPHVSAAPDIDLERGRPAMLRVAELLGLEAS